LTDFGLGTWEEGTARRLIHPGEDGTTMSDERLNQGAGTAAPADADPARSRVVLVVDDTKPHADILVRMLEKAGHEPIAAYDPEEGLRLAFSERPDLILLDVNMPGKSGYDVCQALKEAPETRAIPVMFVTAQDDKQARLRGFEVGGVDYVTKPFEKDIVLARVNAQLRMQEMNEQVVRMRERLYQAHRMEGIATLAAGIAHEFNNIMTGITGYAQLALREASPELVRRALDTAMELGERGTVVARNLLKFASRPSAFRECADVNAVIGEVLSLLESHFSHENIELRVEYGRVPALSIDPAGLREVMLNLLTNARQALLAKTAARRIDVRTSTADGHVTILVADTGVGIPEKALDRVFDPFFTTKGVLAGGSTQCTGLGLSIVHGFVSDNNGTVQVTSEENSGTTVMIRLPVTGAPDRRPHASVLVIDDDPAILKIFSHFVSRAGHVVDTAQSVKKGVELLRREKYDVLLLDWMMGDGSGEDVLEEVANVSPGLPVVVVTASRSPDVARRAMEAGARECVGKPLNHRKVLFLIEKYAGLPTLAATAAKRQAPVAGNGEIVLIVDPEQITRELCERVLRHYGYRTVTAEDIPGAVAAVRSEYFDLMLVDRLAIVECAGPSVRELKAANPYTPVVITSNDEWSDSLVAEGLDSGAAAVIRKPTRIEEFLVKVRAIIDVFRESVPAAAGNVF